VATAGDVGTDAQPTNPDSSAAVPTGQARRRGGLAAGLGVNRRNASQQGVMGKG